MPVHTPLESWHAVVPPPAIPGEQVALARPAVAARLETRDLATVLKATAAVVGSSVAGVCDWESSADIVNGEVARLARERRGTPYATPFATEWIGELEHGGWWLSSVATKENFAASVFDAGGWLDPAFERGEITKAIETRGGPSLCAPAPIAGPDHSESAAREYPQRATTFTPAVVDLVGSQNQPSLFELLGQPEGAAWQPWVEISGELAQSIGVAAGSRVRVQSQYGSIEAIAVAVDGANVDSVAIAHIPVIPSGGRWARTSRADVRLLWPKGRPALGTVPVRVTKV
jgi:anaerobic selenocysteine-containing dehydrogenase